MLLTAVPHCCTIIRMLVALLQKGCMDGSTLSKLGQAVNTQLSKGASLTLSQMPRCPVAYVQPLVRCVRTAVLGTPFFSRARALTTRSSPLLLLCCCGRCVLLWFCPLKQCCSVLPLLCMASPTIICCCTRLFAQNQIYTCE